MLESEIVITLQFVKESKMYAIVHFMGFDEFGAPLPGLKLHENAPRNIYQDEHCFLIRGWSKNTSDIEKPLRNAHETTPVLARINLETFQRSSIVVEDHGSAYSHSRLLVLGRCLCCVYES